jgi:hypothetical protein
MKTIQTALNEQQYKQFKRKVAARKMTEYGYLKSLLLKDLSNV